MPELNELLGNEPVEAVSVVGVGIVPYSALVPHVDAVDEIYIWTKNHVFLLTEDGWIKVPRHPKVIAAGADV